MVEVVVVEELWVEGGKAGGFGGCRLRGKVSVSVNLSQLGNRELQNEKQVNQHLNTTAPLTWCVNIIPCGNIIPLQCSDFHLKFIIYTVYVRMYKIVGGSSSTYSNYSLLHLNDYHICMYFVW